MENPSLIQDQEIKNSDGSENKKEITLNTEIAQLKDNGDFCESAIDKTFTAVNVKVLDEIIFQTLEKVKDFFYTNSMDEQKLAEFMYTMLTLNDDSNDIEEKTKINPLILDQMVNQVLKNLDINEIDNFNEVIEKLLGKDTAKLISEKLGNEKVDTIIENLLGTDIKKLICDKLDNDNLDDLLNKLVDEKLNLDDNPDAKHPNFNAFIDKILGKETQQFIKQKLEMYAIPAIDSENVDKNEVPDLNEPQT